MQLLCAKISGAVSAPSGELRRSQVDDGCESCTQYAGAYTFHVILRVSVRHESSNSPPIVLHSSSSPPNSNSRVPPPQLHRSVPNPQCINYNFLGLSKYRAIALVFRELFFKQTPETSLQDSARIPRPRPSSQSSRRARRNSDLYSPNTAHNSCPSTSPIVNASYVFPRSGPLLHLQRNARKAPHKADGYVSSLVRSCLRTRLGYGIDG